MSYRIRYHRLISRDLEGIAAWVGDFAGREAAGERLTEIRARIRSLKTLPHVGTLRNEVLPGLRVVHAAKKAVITFVIDEDAAEVFIYSVTYGGADWAMRTRRRGH